MKHVCSLLPQKYKHASTKRNTVNFRVEINVGLDGVEQADRYLVSLIKDKQVGVTLLHRRLNCLYDGLLFYLI